MNGSAYIMVVLGILLAKGLGFLRDIVFASVFGATAYTDIYFQIFGLVTLIFTGIGVALSTLVIKNLNKPQNSGDAAQKKYVSSFITKTSVIVIFFTVLLYIFARPVAKLLLPGLSEDLYSVSVKLMYIMLPSFLFVIIAYIISGVLQNLRIFFISSVMSLPFNVIIIASLFIKDVDIITVGAVTTIGWFLHIAIQLPAFYKKGFRLFTLKPEFKTADSLKSEVLWIFISNMMFQVCFLIDKAFVSGESGAATTINYASNLFVTIASVFVVALSNVVYPSISKNFEEGNIEYVKELVSHMITLIFAIFTPFILTVCCYGKNIIRLLYERGEFTPRLTEITALLFAIYSLGAFGYVCQELFNKILYLDSKYSYTVLGTLIIIAVKPVINLFAADYGVLWVSLTTAVLFTAYAINIAVGMKKVIGRYLGRALLSDIAKILCAALGAFLVFALSEFFLPELSEGSLSFIIPLGLCAVVYAGILFATGMFKKLLRRES